MKASCPVALSSSTYFYGMHCSLVACDRGLIGCAYFSPFQILDLTRNNLTSLAGIENCVRLEQLLVTDNPVSSLFMWYLTIGLCASFCMTWWVHNHDILLTSSQLGADEKLVWHGPLSFAGPVQW